MHNMHMFILSSNAHAVPVVFIAVGPYEPGISRIRACSGADSESQTIQSCAWGPGHRRTHGSVTPTSPTRGVRWSQDKVQLGYLPTPLLQIVSTYQIHQHYRRPGAHSS